MVTQGHLRSRVLALLSSFKFSWWASERIYFETESEIALQGHPRLFISVPIERAYATSY